MRGNISGDGFTYALLPFDLKEVAMPTEMKWSFGWRRERL
jgi:hypothetical protein